MANLSIYFIFLFAFLSIGGASDNLYADEQDSKIIYLDINSIDSDNDSNDLDAISFSFTGLALLSQETKLNHFYDFSVNTFSIRAFCIRAPPYFS